VPSGCCFARSILRPLNIPPPFFTFGREKQPKHLKNKSNSHYAAPSLLMKSISSAIAPPTGIFLLLCTFVCMFTLPSFATLGQDASSVHDDQAHLNASERVVVRQLYSVHEMQTALGTTVRQYVSPDGTVFAISWQGANPDLRQLLGRHFDEFMAAASKAARGGRGMHIETGDLVFESGGHMRYVAGRALLRSKMPSGVTRDEIR
jgi:hypothetical protein